MKGKTSVFFVLLSLTVIVSVRSQTSGVGRFSDLSLSITSARESYLLMEPIPLVFRLSNDTNNTIAGHATFRFSCSAVEVFVRHPGGEVRKISPLSSFKARCIIRDNNIPPGSSTQDTQVLMLGLDRNFPSSGIYGLQAALRSNNGSDRIRSPWITISVSEPQGANLAAYEYLKGNTDLSSLYHREGTLETRVFFESFLGSYKGTPYGPYIALDLARNYIFRDELDKAKEILDELKQLNDFALASDVDEGLKKLERKRKGEY